MSDVVKIPSDITVDEAKKEHIPYVIIEPPTKKELEDVRRKAKFLQSQSASLLPPSPRRVEVEFARRGEIVWSNELVFISANYEKLGEEEATKRFRAASVNLCESLLRQGKLQECSFVAWEGMKHGANTQQYLQRSNELMLALNTPDDLWCDCPDQEILEDENNVSGVFGGNPDRQPRVIDVVPALQVVDEIPSYKHEGKTVAVVRCNVCGITNAVPVDDLPNRVLNVEGKRHNPAIEQQRDRSSGRTF